MADSAAARKQAEGAHRHVEALMKNDPKVKILPNAKCKLGFLFCRKTIQLLQMLQHQFDTSIQRNTMLKLKNTKQVNRICLRIEQNKCYL